MVVEILVITDVLPDYVLLSPQMCSHICEFSVSDFDPLYSDIHSCIAMAINHSTTGRLLNSKGTHNYSVDTNNDNVTPLEENTDNNINNNL